jgi:hypothetical protein
LFEKNSNKPISVAHASPPSSKQEVLAEPEAA